MNNITLSDIARRMLLAGRIVILTHYRADADTLGSAVALSEMLTSLGKKVKIYNGDLIPERLTFLTDMGDFEKDGNFKPDLIMSVDVASAGMLGALRDEYGNNTEISIDHHIKGTAFAEYTFVEDSGSCAEIIFELSQVLCDFCGNDLINKNAATALYAAISSDTGSFKYESVTSETHKIIAALLEKGIDHAEISRRLFDTNTKTQVKATGIAINALKFYANGKIALISFTQKMLSDNGLKRDDIESIIDIARKIEGVEIGISVKQAEENANEYKVSFRSKRYADVSALAAEFGGGGHIRAAGCTLIAPNADEAERMIAEAAEKYIKKGGCDDGEG